MSYLIDFIKQYPNDWEDRLNKKLITVKRQGDLAIFNYSILADFTDNYVREARGIIIDLDTMRVVAWPFTKFCNYGEKGADKIDWDSAYATEKIDGSLIKIYYYNNKWYSSTMSTIDASKTPCGDSGFTFGALFGMAAKQQHLNYSKLNTNYTYIFELITPYNPIVVNYNGITKIYHTGTRNNTTGQEINIDIGIEKPKFYNCSTLDECIKTVASFNNTTKDISQEGIVVCDKNFHRIKVKNIRYIEVHRLAMNHNFSDERIIELIQNGDYEEILTYFPYLQASFYSWSQKINQLKADVNNYCKAGERECKQYNLTRAEWAKKHNKDKLFSFGIKYIFDNNILSVTSLSPKKIKQLIEG